MKKIIIIRHAESEGNYRHIIQGGEEDYGLTEQGNKLCKQRAEEMETQLESCTHIMCSPTKRAYQTAELIKKTTNLPCIIKQIDLLKEVDAGILSGHTHQEAKVFFPKEYKVWIERKDLNEIKNAEKGSQLQARVLAFLVQYFQNEEYDDLIVSHAGFIRSFINTIQAVSRENQINIPNCEYFIMNDVWKKINYKIIKENSKGLILYVRTIDAQYLIKRYNRLLDDFELELDKIQNRVQAVQNNIPEVYFSGNVETATGHKYGVRVYSYLEGNHKYGELGQKKIIDLIKNIENLSREYNKYNITKSYDEHNLFFKFENTKYNYTNNKLKNLREMILKEPRYSYLKKQKVQILTLYDLHRDNILFYENDIMFIDMGSIIWAPTVFQIAVVVVETFMLYSVKEGLVCLNYYLETEKCSLEDIKLCMLIRVFMGISFFENNKINGKEKYLEMYWYAYNFIANN